MNGTAARLYETNAETTPQNKIDEFVFARLKKLGIQPAKLCDDATFVRRVHLDVNGTLPTADETRNFIADPSPNKRKALIEKLLSTEAFADYWAMKWSDVLRVKSEFPINLWPLGAQAYHRWIRDRIRENQPYDRFARMLLTASGSNFRDPQVNFYRAVQAKQPEAIAKAVALSFMGTRADKWPKAKLGGMATLFSKVGYKNTAEWKEEIVFFDPSKKATAKPAFPDGTAAKLGLDQDPRYAFADWLIDAKNPWFAKAAANRIWGWLMGRGIVEEPDDIRPDNPPSDPALLAYLEKELIAAKWDLKHLYRLILNSQAYQLSCVPAPGKTPPPSSFAHYPLRRLEAEVLIDAVNQITGATDEYSSQTPEPFTFVPTDQKSVALADGSITSAFLQLFGRPARDTGMEAERDDKPSAGQRLHFLNSSHIRIKIERGPKMKNIGGGKTGREAVEEIYLTVLSRFPTDRELLAIADYSNLASSKIEAAVDVIWALLNSAEFEYRH